jgi:hypothetical protein
MKDFICGTMFRPLSLFIFLLLVRWSTCATTNTTSCSNPFFAHFASYQSTCDNTKVGRNGTEDYLTAFASFSHCNSQNDSINTASVFFTDRYTAWSIIFQPQHDNYFDYTIFWPTNDSFCVVDLTPDLSNEKSSINVVSWRMIDRNDLSNNPTEVCSITF